MYNITINGSDEEYEVLDKYQVGGTLMLWCRNPKTNASKIVDVTWVKEVKPPTYTFGISGQPEPIHISDGPLYKIEDYQQQKYLISHIPGQINWTDNFEHASLFTEDIAKINMNILSGAAERPFLRMVECDKDGKEIIN